MGPGERVGENFGDGKLYPRSAEKRSFVMKGRTNINTGEKEA